MQLKERQFDPRYIYAKLDFESLETMHKDYVSYFGNHQIFPAEKYNAEADRIKKQWIDHPVSGGCRSMESDLEQLLYAYRKVEGRENLQRVVINQLFGKLYSYFWEMFNDNAVGYLTDEKWSTYLTQYQKAIKFNKDLKLTGWNQSPIENIEKEIAKIVTKK